MSHDLVSGGTLGNLVISAVARFGDRPAIGDDRKRWSYRELGEQMGRIVAVLRGLGLGPGSSLSMLSPNRAEVWAVMNAALIMGMRYTPLHPLSAEDDQAYVIEDAEADILIVDGETFADRGRVIKQRVPGLKHLMAFGEVDGIPDLLKAVAAAEPAPLVDQGSGGEVAWLAYTGGTTGRSKGVMMPHRAMTAAVLSIYADWEWPVDVRYLASTPVSHAAAVFLWPTMMRGGFSFLVPGFQPDHYCRTVERERINALMLVPTAIYTLLDDEATRAKYDLSSIELIAYGAAPMSPDRLRQAIDVFGQNFAQFYGLTEAPLCITSMRKSDHDVSKPHRFGSCGRITALTDVKLFDPQMREVGLGEPGEICLRGPLAMKGYWKLPEATEKAFRGGWLHTGDVATKDEEGFLYIVDRTKDMIISGGFNIYPREVEDTLMSHPAVASAAVIGVPDQKWGEAVKAFVVLKQDTSINAEELKAFVKAKRGAAWAPKSIDFVKELALTALGKIDRKAMRAPYWSGQARSVA
ncbi:AMP-binding protein [Bradyrhizobium sp. AS23.2]|uniref:AMP-binding protein n=1 Tax=Bradyrhizobium sp. AS23.2 TaxID=1680155 RepID=UPI00093DF700|nr:AMP-binding protein [Bradyrhizobium sp. AS23.2]OKO69304.1 acyl-CoA synthetase [Bradyrhizobium sp. AS23.2]